MVNESWKFQMIVFNTAQDIKRPALDQNWSFSVQGSGRHYEFF